MRKIEMCDLRTQYTRLQQDINLSIKRVLSSGQYIRGDEVNAFEHEIAEYQQCRHAIGVGNGTDALMIALMALDLKPGDEVIAPDFTFVATAEVVRLLGLKLVLCDVDEETYCMSAESLRKSITQKTKAIIPVHLFGQHAPMDEITDIANANRVYLIEDTCQSLGATYTFPNSCKKKSGTMGIIGCTSFFPTKNLGCYGDGGALFTDNDDIAERIRMIANHGSRVKYHNDLIGVNSRLDALQAAILRVKLQHLDQFIEARQQAAKAYNERLADISWIETPKEKKESSHTYHQYTIRCKERDRDEIREKLTLASIPSMVYYPIPLHKQKVYQMDTELPVSERLSQEVLSLPMHTELDKEQIDYITETIRNI